MSFTTYVSMETYFDKNICCGYSLESPRRGDSNELRNICFYGEISKLIP